MLTARTTYLVVFNGLKPEEEHSRLEYWMKVRREPFLISVSRFDERGLQTIINFVQSPVPIIAIATHADDKDMTPAQRKKVTTVFENLKENFPALEHLFFVNARLGKGKIKSPPAVEQCAALRCFRSSSLQEWTNCVASSSMLLLITSGWSNGFQGILFFFCILS